MLEVPDSRGGSWPLRDSRFSAIGYQAYVGSIRFTRRIVAASRLTLEIVAPVCRPLGRQPQAIALWVVSGDIELSWRHNMILAVHLKNRFGAWTVPQSNDLDLMNAK
jgi:hypothetical protein